LKSYDHVICNISKQGIGTFTFQKILYFHISTGFVLATTTSAIFDHIKDDIKVGGKTINNMKTHYLIKVQFNIFGELVEYFIRVFVK
jgi:hypothetical protein